MEKNQHLRLHPWHGVTNGAQCPQLLTAYIELTPTDTVKYEIDKTSGILKIDRPQKYSNICPTLYGFIPQTYCHQHTANFCMQQTQRTNLIGDGDPLDICVFTEKQITRGDILLQAIPIGGLRLIDNNEVDDKIIAVLKNDLVFGNFTNITHLSQALIDRLCHYFLTYKDLPNFAPQHNTNPEITPTRKVEIDAIYDAQTAHKVIQHSIMDYNQHFKK